MVWANGIRLPINPHAAGEVSLVICNSVKNCQVDKPMSVAVIVLDAAKLTESGILATDLFKAGKLSWNIRSGNTNSTLAMRYTVDTSRPESMTLKLEYRVQTPEGRSEDMNYKIPLRRGNFDGRDIWGFICPSTKKIVSRLMLHPGDRYFIGDPRSVLILEDQDNDFGEDDYDSPSENGLDDIIRAPVAAIAPLRATTRPKPAASAAPPAAPAAAPPPPTTNATAPREPVIVSPSMPVRATAVRPAAPTPQAQKPTEHPLTRFARALRDYCEGKDISLAEGRVDPFLRFGLQLFMLGATNGMANDGRLASGQSTRCLSDAVAVLNIDPSRIPDLLTRQDEYLGIPKYALMMQLGEDTAFAFLHNEPALATKFADALNKWRNRIEIKNTTSQYTFMFTDIVSSVQFTTTHGDRVMHELVTSHNNIVRTALRSENGREVKHTGDGIMAVFDRSSDGIEAAMRIQREIRRYNTQHPDLPLRVRIGLNAGEARVEDDDYLGIAVQLAARVCAAAGADEVLVSGIVRELAAGMNYNYANAREVMLKGFPEPKTVASVVWE